MQGIFVGSTYVENGFTFSTITAIASLSNNQTSFVCQRSEGVVNPPISTDPPLNMTVFGRPAPPSQLSVSPEATAVLHLHWEEPFSLEGENISFTLNSTNLKTGTVVMVEEETETCITFERPEGDDECDRYDFSILSENLVGLSEPSATVTAGFPSGPQSVEEVDISVVRDGGDLTVTLSFNGTESCQDYPATNYNITLTTIGRPALMLGPFGLSGGAERTTITPAAHGLLEDSVYSATVVAWNEYGTTSSEESRFYTTDIQDASVEVDGDTVTIVCTFLTGTSVRGCRIDFLVPVNPTPLLTVDVDRGNDSSTAELVHRLAQQLPAVNSYQVLVYDLKADGRVGGTALMATVDIVPSISPSTGTPASSDISSPIATASPTDTSTLNPSPGLTSGTLSAIIGASVAVVVLLVLILITVIVIITTCNVRQKRRARERLFLERQNPNELLYNMAYEQCNPAGLNATKGGASLGASLGASESQDHAYDIPKLAAAVPIAATAANPMYAGSTPIHSGGSDSPRYTTTRPAAALPIAATAANPMYGSSTPIHSDGSDSSRYTTTQLVPGPVYEEVKLKEASVTNGIKVNQNISYGCLPEVTVDEQ